MKEVLKDMKIAPEELKPRTALSYIGGYKCEAVSFAQARTRASTHTERRMAEVFALLPTRNYRWDNQARKPVLTYGKREAADEACRKVFALAQERPAAVPLFVQEARSWLCRKASGDYHDYKILAAMLENAEWVSPEWQPHLLAASVHYSHGKQSPDYPAVQQAREALRIKG